MLPSAAALLTAFLSILRGLGLLARCCSSRLNLLKVINHEGDGFDSHGGRGNFAAAAS